MCSLADALAVSVLPRVALALLYALYCTVEAFLYQIVFYNLYKDTLNQTNQNPVPLPAPCGRLTAPASALCQGHTQHHASWGLVGSRSLLVKHVATALPVCKVWPEAGSEG